ncbi:LemA family protein [Dyadobacter sandarakinus]|uniref:LemA family protein n=1 Tax=Dyadobacter sandarakinus TaxID=2747268 RepID=A0ABX7I896_9BACT|nr:LemA family protein [Dyadobacter sandarakinus]QRR02319.1 LemA family protein [Dyadobacter sandarakinus]
MSKGLIAVIVIVLIFGFVGCGKYNGLVGKDEVVKESWAKVESQYQRRADLIPNLVNTVKGAAEFEKSTLTGVIEARAKATQTTISADQLTPENIAKFQSAQDQLGGALSRLLVSVERYPELKANQNFLELQAQLEGTENRITVARNDFNTVVKDYNQEVRTFPTNLFAGIFGFSQKGYFTAAAGADKAPTVQF